MRGLNVIIFLAAFALIIPTVPYVFPGYNNGNGIPTTSDGNYFITLVGQWQISALSPQLNTFGGVLSILDLALLSVKIILFAITFVLGLASVVLFAYPIITMVFPIPAVLGAIIQMIIYIAEGSMLIQVIRGTPWGLNE
jgi:hypothetical protein